MATPPPTTMRLPHYAMVLALAFTAAVGGFPTDHDACDAPDTIVIRFPEIDPPTDVASLITSANSPYAQKLLNGSPFSLEVENDLSQSPSPSQDFNNLFEIPPVFFGQNGTYIKMKGGIDRDGVTGSPLDDVNGLSYRLKCQATPTSTMRYLVLKIQIQDGNDNAPVFQQPSLAVDIDELTPVGLAVISTISATDIDEGKNRQVSYSLAKACDGQFDGTKYFEFRSDHEGILVVKQSLDFEPMYQQTGQDSSKVFYKMVVIATDSGDVPQSSEMELVVTIVDGDDQGPTFDYPTCIRSNIPYSKPCIRPKYQTKVSSTPPCPSGGHVLQLMLTPVPADPNNSTFGMSMHDLDTLNSPVSCSVLESQPARYKTAFQATAQRTGSTDKYRCVLTQMETISRKDVTQIELIILAVDDNARVDYATVIVDVEPSDLFPPQISGAVSGFMYEHSPLLSRAYSDHAGTQVLKLSFTDGDMNAGDPAPTYDINILEQNIPFAVSQEGYIVLQTLPLKYETQNQYIFTVEVKEQTTAQRSATASLTVSILDLQA